MALTCRICKSRLSKKIFHMPDMPLTDDFVDISKPNRAEYISDIDIYQCDHCGIAQNPADFDHETYYRDYQYTSGHSEFTQQFMREFSEQLLNQFHKLNHRPAMSIVEAGSGDGAQLRYFKNQGAKKVLGIEPSAHLAKNANEDGIHTKIALFDSDCAQNLNFSADIFLSSYTFDHIRQPIEYLRAAYEILIEGGILAIEVHDFEKIIERTEYCLFEHEHTIYLNEENARDLLEKSGFSLICTNPLPSSVTRANSLILIAQKTANKKFATEINASKKDLILDDLQNRIASTIDRIDSWIKNTSEFSSIVGFGAGGRGVMTVAALKEHKKLHCLLDSNYESGKYLAPKSRIPIAGPDTWNKYKDSHCIVFSFGYFNEIQDKLVKSGFSKEKIISLLDFYAD